MKPHQTIDPALDEALAAVSDFIRQVTGRKATQSEIADALTRYFVLKEIKDHILMMREDAT